MAMTYRRGPRNVDEEPSVIEAVEISARATVKTVLTTSRPRNQAKYSRALRAVQTLARSRRAVFEHVSAT